MVIFFFCIVVSGFECILDVESDDARRWRGEKGENMRVYRPSTPGMSLVSLFLPASAMVGNVVHYTIVFGNRICFTTLGLGCQSDMYSSMKSNMFSQCERAIYPERDK